jgi:hypothetical protein
MAIKQMSVCQCDLCGHIWLPSNIDDVKKAKWPVACAKCKSHCWNNPALLRPRKKVKD